jgi:hypothetical protein
VKPAPRTKPALLSPDLATDEAMELYATLYNKLRARSPDPDSLAITWREVGLLVNLIDAWRAHEQRKHIALKHALSRARRRLGAGQGDSP